MNITTNNANTAYAKATDFSNEGVSGFYAFDCTDDGFTHQGNPIIASDDLVTFLIPIQEGDIIVNNSNKAWTSGVNSPGLMRLSDLHRIKQLKPSGAADNQYVKIASAKHYVVTAEDIAEGADTFVTLYRISTQTAPFVIKRIRA